jgi:hypothetical protein
MLKLTEYIVEVPSGEIIWITKSVKNILLSYNMINYDVNKKFYFFNSIKRRDIDNIINYETMMVS